MNETATKALAALRDVKGVEGSFYATREGEILARDLPRIYDGDELEGVASRVARILDALVDLGGTNEGALVRHPHHAVFVRGTEHGVLGVLATSDVNVPALRRGANLVARRLPAAAELDRVRIATLPPLPTDVPAPTLVPPTVPAPHAGSLPPPLPPPVPAPVAAAAPSRTSPPRISVPGAPTGRVSSPNPSAVRWRGTVKDG